MNLRVSGLAQLARAHTKGSLDLLREADLIVQSDQGGNSGSTSHTISAFSIADDSWTETGVKWSNKPAKGTSQATATVTAAGWYEWTVTNFVNAQLAGDDTVSLYLTDENNSNVWTQWYCRESSGTTYDPRLVVISQ